MTTSKYSQCISITNVFIINIFYDMENILHWGIIEIGVTQRKVSIVGLAGKLVWSFTK